MKDFLALFLIEPFTSGNCFLWIFGLIMWGCFLALAGLLFCGIITAIDSWFMPTLEGSGKIYDKSVVPAHTTITYMKVGNSTIPIVTKHPDAYYVDIEIDGRKDSVGVKKKYYKDVQMGTIVNCKYNLGRLFTTSLYIDKISQ